MLTTLPLSPQLRRLHQHANVLLLERFSGEHLSLGGQERRTLASRLLQKYRDGIGLGGWGGGEGVQGCGGEGVQGCGGEGVQGGGGEGVQGCGGEGVQGSGMMWWVVGCGE